MNLSFFSSLNRQRCEAANGFNHPVESWSVSDWFTATMGELGEAANIAKKLNRVRDGIPGNLESPEKLELKLGRELADTFIYLDLLAQRCGIDLEQAVRETFDNKSKQIGFPLRIGPQSDLRCPTCNSPEPSLHPSVQLEGEVHICSDSFHKP